MTAREEAVIDSDTDGDSGYVPSEEDLLRARFYGLLATLFAGPPDAETLAQLTRLRGDDSPIGRPLGELSSAAAEATPEAAESEYNALFIGLARGEVVPFASYYLSGYLYEKPLAELRDDLARLGLARGDGVSEPEDHIASLMEVMQRLILGEGRGGDEDALAVQKDFFARHLGSWAGAFFDDVEAAEAAAFYRAAARLGRAFLTVEGEALSMV